MCTSRYPYQAPSSMLRTRRRDANLRPNRWLDKKSSRGMLFENEELRLRTIEINAEVERGQGDIKKLKRQNDQLRRDIWTLRDEYDKLEDRYRRLCSVESVASSEEECDEYEDDEDGDEEQEGAEEQEGDKESRLQEQPGSEDEDNRQNAHRAASSQFCHSEDNDVMSTGHEPVCHEVDPDLERANRGAADVLVIDSGGTPDTQTNVPCATNFLNHPEHRSLRAVASDTEVNRQLVNFRRGTSDAKSQSVADIRLSLPLGVLEHQRNDCDSFGNERSTSLHPMWPAATRVRPTVMQEPWRQPVWAVTAYQPARSYGHHSHSQQNIEQQAPGCRLRRRVPPPPPVPAIPKCEQVATVRQESRVLPDGTTRRSVTFHSDFVTYIPPALDSGDIYIPTSTACPCHDNQCLSMQPNTMLIREGSFDTTLVVRGLERVPGITPREIIDAIENRVGPSVLRQAIRGVCLHQTRPAPTVLLPHVHATVSVYRRDVALRLLLCGLEVRGETLQLEEKDAFLGNTSGWRSGADRGTRNARRVLMVSGVTHQVSDGAVRSAVLRACGLHASHVRRNMYKGVDTGERLVDVTSSSDHFGMLSLECPDQSVQESREAIESSNACHSGSEAHSSDSESKFRSHLSVRLRKPGDREASVPCESSSDEVPASAAAVRQAPNLHIQLPNKKNSTAVPSQSVSSTSRHLIRASSGSVLPGTLAPTPAIPAIALPPQAQNPARPPHLCNGPVSATSPPPYLPPPPPPVRVAADIPAPAEPLIRRPSTTRNVLVAEAPRNDDSPTKQRSSVNFEERRASKKRVSTNQPNGGILRRPADDLQQNRRAKSRSVSVESTRGVSGPHRRRHGVFERPNSDDFLLEGVGDSYCSSREGSTSRQLAIIPPSGSVPWCACWGNGCI